MQATSVEVYPDMKPVVTAKAKATVAPYRGDKTWGLLRTGNIKEKRKENSEWEEEKKEEQS